MRKVCIGGAALDGFTVVLNYYQCSVYVCMYVCVCVCVGGMWCSIHKVVTYYKPFKTCEQLIDKSHIHHTGMYTIIVLDNSKPLNCLMI